MAGADPHGPLRERVRRGQGSAPGRAPVQVRRGRSLALRPRPAEDAGREREHEQRPGHLQLPAFQASGVLICVEAMLYICVYIYIYMYRERERDSYISLCIYICMYVCMYVCIYIYIYMCMYTYIYIYIHIPISGQ